MKVQINMERVREHLSSFNFQKLFTEELGWDCHPNTLSITVADMNYRLQAVAEKRGLVAWTCAAIPGRKMPEGITRKKIEAEVAKITRENLVIFIDSEREKQIWCWARREPGRPVAMREHVWHKEAKNTVFLQKLYTITFSINEEAELNLSGVTSRISAAFDVEKVTKAFYNEFQKKHRNFMELIKGIEDEEDCKWYASLMLNRLMFIYFMQRKRFFNNDPDYLRNRLRHCKEEKGEDQFHTFYRHFLLRLFHEGLGNARRTKELDKLLGRVPYLNGGLFEKHAIEERYPNIHIPDQAFQDIFGYFEKYQWHLDENPLREDNHINPDILGRIFEKHVNQKEMGAYYTGEDIADYITKNSVLPRLFDMAKAKCKIAFDNSAGPTVWDHLRNDPKRYIFPDMQYGLSLPLPKEIEEGRTNLAARSQWNNEASIEFTQSNETWREVVARRTHCEMIYAKLIQGEICEINDLITFNLDVLQFSQDVIERCEGPDLLRAFWEAIRNITVLDPTCGSGAFLFTALDMLETLYQACLERMRIFLDDAQQKNEDFRDNSFMDFDRALDKISKQPNERYFILKSIILNNIFGVDIMEEAVEICKLRLFLKLAAQVEPDTSDDNLGIEPLPDIDFNVCAGNALVGYSSYHAVKSALSQKLDLDNVAEKINVSARELQEAYDLFRERQLESKDAAASENKSHLRQKQGRLADELNHWLALDYGVDVKDPNLYGEWVENHKPFHWFIDFHGIIERGGFDAIIGNPPYLEIKDVGYQPTDLETVQGRAIHAMCIERSLQIMNGQGAMGMIVPMSITSTQRMKCVQDMLEKGRGGGSGCSVWYSNYAWRPAKLFDQVNRPLTIFISKPAEMNLVFSTNYQRWYSKNRKGLMRRLTYLHVPDLRSSFWIPKLGQTVEVMILRKLLSIKSYAGDVAARSENRIYYRKTGVLYWSLFTDFSPTFRLNGVDGRSSREASISVGEASFVEPLIGILSSGLAWWWRTITSNMRDLNSSDIWGFPVPKSLLESTELKILANQYLDDIKKNSCVKTRHQKKTGKAETQSFNIRMSKKIIDKIDGLIGPVYGLTEDEIEFIINYDIKYRMSSKSDD